VDPDDDSDFGSPHAPKLARRVTNFFNGNKHENPILDVTDLLPGPSKSGNGHQLRQAATDSSLSTSINMLRSLPQNRGTKNIASTDFMMRHSPLTSRNLAVSAEQVSLFLCSDNILISFFEMSASDVERPILKRLSSSGTILRESCDASLLVQAVIDAIIDLAIPLTAAYQDVIAELELEVLTRPSLKQSKQLYIVISEINRMLTFLNPVDNLINMIRDHRTDLTADDGASGHLKMSGGVVITPQTSTYL
jgi:hypothetical protein